MKGILQGWVGDARAYVLMEPGHLGLEEGHNKFTN